MLPTIEATRSHSHTHPPNTLKNAHILYSYSVPYITTSRWPIYTANTCSRIPSVLLGEIWLCVAVCIIHKSFFVIGLKQQE